MKFDIRKLFTTANSAWNRKLVCHVFCPRMSIPFWVSNPQTLFVTASLLSDIQAQTANSAVTMKNGDYKASLRSANSARTPQKSMRLPDFCLAPLESSLLSKLLYPPPNPSVGCWDPRAWSVYHSKRPTYACAKNVAILCLFYVVLTWAPLTTFQIALPTTAHTRYKVQFRPHSRAKTPPISWFSRLCRITFVNP